MLHDVLFVSYEFKTEDRKFFLALFVRGSESGLVVNSLIEQSDKISRPAART